MTTLGSLKPKQPVGLASIVLMNVLATALCVVVGWVGYQFTEPSLRLTPFWPLSGLFLIFYGAYGRKVLPALFTSLVLVTYLFTNRPLWVCGLMAVGNTLEPIIGVALIRAMRRAETHFGTFSNALTVIVAGAIGPLPSSIIGGVLLSILNDFTLVDTLRNMASWWTGHFIGIVVLTPLIATWMARPRIAAREWGGFTVLALLLFGAAVFVFSHPLGSSYLFLLFPVLLLASCWLPNALLYTLALVLQVIALLTFMDGGSVYHTGSPFENIFNLQCFFATVGVTALALTGFRCSSPLQAPAVALLVGWVFSGVLFGLVTTDEMESDKRQFAQLVNLSEQRVQAAFTSYVDTMRAVAGFMTGSDDVNRTEWLRFLDYLDWDQRSPGLMGVSVVKDVREAEVPSFVQKMRARGYPEFRIKPLTGMKFAPGADHLVLTLLAPEDRNTSAIGLDLNTEPHRRAAFERSRAMRVPTLSAQVQPVNTVPSAVNYALVVPYFAKASHREVAPTEPVAGFIYGPINVERFFSGVLGATEQLHCDVFIEAIKDGELVYHSSHEPRRGSLDYEAVSTFLLGGQRFEIGWHRTPMFRSSVSFVTVLLSCTGALLSLVLAGLVRKLELAGSDARLLAQQKTEQLAERDFQFAEQAATLSRIMNSVPVGIFRADRRGLLVLCNEEWGQITGRAPQRSQGNYWLTPFHRHDREGAAKLLSHAMDRPTQVHGEFRVVRPDGTVRTVEVVLVAETGSGRLDVGFLGTIQDLTEYKAAQEVLEMQRAVVAHSAKMASLGEMAGGIAHEINNPLAIIHGKSRQMRRMLEAGQVEEPVVVESLDLIERTAMRISKIIKGLRAFSRSGEDDPFTKESLASILDQTLDLCRERFKNSGVDLRVAPIPTVQVECRGTQIGQVVMNLLSNAFDAVQDCTERWVSLEARDLGEHVEISVTDSGRGIDPAIQEKIFQPFFTTKEIGNGTGLGLSIARGIVADHGGRLYVDETVKNTRFIMELKKDPTRGD